MDRHTFYTVSADLNIQDIQTLQDYTARGGWSTALYLSQNTDTGCFILLQYKWKFYSHILLRLKYWNTCF